MRPIDADALAKFIDCGHLNNPNEKLYSENDIREMIGMMPTIDAVPVRHGKWEVTPVYIKCSECGESFLLIPQNYCPNCGARMDVE